MYTRTSIHDTRCVWWCVCVYLCDLLYEHIYILTCLVCVSVLPPIPTGMTHFLYTFSCGGSSCCVLLWEQTTLWIIPISNTIRFRETRPLIASSHTNSEAQPYYYAQPHWHLHFGSSNQHTCIHLQFYGQQEAVSVFGQTCIEKADDYGKVMLIRTRPRQLHSRSIIARLC